MTDFEERLLKAVERIAAAVEEYVKPVTAVQGVFPSSEPIFPRDPDPKFGVELDTRPTQDGEVIKLAPFVDTSGKPLA